MDPPPVPMMDDVDDDAITLPLIPDGAPLSYVDSWDAFWTEFDAREAAKTQGPLPILVVDELEASVRRKGTAAFEAQPRSELVDPAFGIHPSLVAYATTKPFLTTREATAYCGFKTASALRKAKLEGRIAPAGRRGGLGTWMWPRESLDCFLRGALARRAPGRVPATERSGAPPYRRCTWRSRGSGSCSRVQWISTEPVLPRVWQRKEGGHVVRARVIDKSTGRQKEIWKVLANADAPAALKWIEDECKRVRAGVASVETQKTRFCDYATSLFERKVATKEIKSASGRERWRYTLEHLIAGTENVAGFGDIFIDEIRPLHVEAWRAGIGRLIGRRACTRRRPQTAGSTSSGTC